MRILVVEDEHKIANAIKQGLVHQSYAVDVAYNGDDGLAMATTEPYDLIILDRMLPGSIDGMGILKELRNSSNNTPVLLLTAKDRVVDKAYGLNMGADDYLVKPFAFVELVARVRALLRRPSQDLGTTLSYNTLSLNTELKEVGRDGKNIDLTVKEFALLEFLLRNPDTIISKDRIMSQVWDYDADILPNTVEVYIGYLRNKVDKGFSGPALINTKRGFGYYLGLKK